VTVATANPFERVEAVGLTLPGVETGERSDGSPVLRTGGHFMAWLADHKSAEPETLVVRVDPADREHLLEEAPETYYLTDYYAPRAVVLVRLAQIDRDVLFDLLSVSRRMTLAKIWEVEP
jgi:hypothetical protein